MKGYTRTSGVLIRSSDNLVTQINLDHLKAAFTKNGSFKGNEFSRLMEAISDETKFAIDSATQTITSKTSGLKYSNGPTNGSFGQGEKHSLTHIVRGHVENDSFPAKSHFNDPGEILSLVDQVWANPSKQAFSNNGWIVDFDPKVVGTRGEKKVRIHVDGDQVRSAFPIF